MFHQAAGGKRFTKLGDSPLSSLDLSGVLSKERCVLVARLDKPVTVPVMSDASGEGQGAGEIESLGGQRHTMLRLVLPIEVMPDYR